MGQQAVQPGDADVVEAVGREAVGPQRQQALVGDGAVGGPGGDDEHRRPDAVVVGSRYSRHRPSCGRRAVLGDDGLGLVVGRPGQQHRRPCRGASSSPTMRTHCSGVLPGP